jgi:hypothetical protein
LDDFDSNNDIHLQGIDSFPSNVKITVRTAGRTQPTERKDGQNIKIEDVVVSPFDSCVARYSVELTSDDRSEMGAFYCQRNTTYDTNCKPQS